jgi:hypothetical protein
MGRIRIAGSCPFELFGKPATSPLWLRLVLVDGARNRFLRVENAGLQITEPFRYACAGSEGGPGRTSYPITISGSRSELGGGAVLVNSGGGSPAMSASRSRRLPGLVA